MALPRLKIINTSQGHNHKYVTLKCLVLRRFVFTTIHFYDTCRDGPSSPDLWFITVETQASSLYLLRL